MNRAQHRPYPLSSKPWFMRMEWLNLLFMHWPVPASSLRDFIPDALELDTYDNKAWLGIVPFEMCNVRPRYVPSLPWISHFVELNVRTYVTANNKPGVWFFSLDAANPLAVRLARKSFHLPYMDAKMSCIPLEQTIYYQSKRTHNGATAANFIASYQPKKPVSQAKPGSLLYFLTERYCLYSMDKQGEVYRGEIHHKPWPLQEADANIQVNTMTQQLGLELPKESLHVHFAKYLDVIAWLPETIKKTPNLS